MTSPLVKNFRLGDLYYGLNNARTLLPRIRNALLINNNYHPTSLQANDIPVTVDHYNRFCRMAISNFEKNKDPQQAHKVLLSQLDEADVSNNIIRELYVQHLTRLIDHYDNEQVGNEIIEFSNSRSHCSNEDKLTMQLCLLGLVIANQDGNSCKVHFEIGGFTSDEEYANSFTTIEFNFQKKYLGNSEHIIKYKQGNTETQTTYAKDGSPIRPKQYSSVIRKPPIRKRRRKSQFQTTSRKLNFFNEGASNCSNQKTLPKSPANLPQP